ncbi:MFS transporter, partial [Streptococcus pyogenes]
GPTYGGIMTSHFTWNHIFLFLVPVLILSLIIGWFAIPEMAVQKSGYLDWISVLGICLLFSGSLTFLSTLGTVSSWIALIIGGIGWFLF